jgi:hypothetical protein
LARHLLEARVNRWSNTGIIAAVIIVIGVLFVGLRSVRTEVTVEPPISIPDASEDPSAAVVISRLKSGGFSLFGLQFGTVTYSVTVQLYAEPGCYDRIADGGSWPPSISGCDSPVAIEGVISGGGIAATGESIIGVDVEVTGDCYDTIERGDAWPPADVACAG